VLTGYKSTYLCWAVSMSSVDAHTFALKPVQGNIGEIDDILSSAQV